MLRTYNSDDSERLQRPEIETCPKCLNEMHYPYKGTEIETGKSIICCEDCYQMGIELNEIK